MNTDKSARVAQASSPASCGTVPAEFCIHVSPRDAADTRSRDGCATFICAPLGFADAFWHHHPAIFPAPLLAKAEIYLIFSHGQYGDARNHARHRAGRKIEAGVGERTWLPGHLLE